MKNQNNSIKTSFFKKIFIKICRLLNYEIIDQSQYSIPTLNKGLDDILSIPGNSSITIPMGKFIITRKIKSFKVIFRSSTNQLILDQNKKRLFDKAKNEYTFRSLNSLLKSITLAKKTFKNIKYEIIVTDTNSSKNDLHKIQSILSKYDVKNKLMQIDINAYKDKITGEYSEGKSANMANFYTSLNLVNQDDGDLFYFIEDDYIHTKNAILEMLFSYEKISSILDKEIFLLPADYPYLYTKFSSTKIFLGHQKHWRLVDESLVSFMTSKKMILDNFEELMKMAKEWIDPWEEPLHKIYKKNPCFSPIPSLSMHCANINSVYGLPPNFGWKSVWDESADYY
jgi:hypothetical protein